MPSANKIMWAHWEFNYSVLPFAPYLNGPLWAHWLIIQVSTRIVVRVAEYSRWQNNLCKPLVCMLFIIPKCDHHQKADTLYYLLLCQGTKVLLGLHTQCLSEQLDCMLCSSIPLCASHYSGKSSWGMTCSVRHYLFLLLTTELILISDEIKSGILTSAVTSLESEISARFTM